MRQQTNLPKNNPSITEFTRGQMSNLAQQVDASLNADFRHLRFPDDLEEVYIRETNPSRVHQMTIYLLIAMVVYDFFLITDFSIISDLFPIAMAIRVSLITPMFLGLVALIRRGISASARESSVGIMMIITGITLLYFMTFSQDPNRIFYHPGFLLIVIFSNIVMQTQFRVAIISSVVLYGLYWIFYPYIQTLPPQVMVANLTILFSCLVITLYANYSLEHEQRTSYLFTLRERLRQGALVTQNRKLSRLILLDPLTRLANRREVDEFIARLGEEPHPDTLAVIMFDIDFFKKYNDLYGHPAGDDCIRQVAHVMRRAVHRKGDIVGRIGGEEFIILLPESDEHNAGDIAELIRSQIVELGLEHRASSINPFVTISAGVSCGKIRQKSDVQDLMENADEALYQSKTYGRNRITVAGSRK
jgi:diguanylate cyclase (GGDEF)-like protein